MSDSIPSKAIIISQLLHCVNHRLAHVCWNTVSFRIASSILIQCEYLMITIPFDKYRRNYLLCYDNVMIDSRH